MVNCQIPSLESSIPPTIKRRIWYTCIVGSLISLPLTGKCRAAYPSPPPFKEILPLLLGLPLFAAMVYKLFLELSSYILKKIELNPFASRPFRDILFPALPYGILFGLALVVTERLFFPSLVLPGGALESMIKLIKADSFSWKWQLLGALYATINVEVVERLFLLPTLLFVLGKIEGSQQPWRSFGVRWSSIFLTGLIAGMFPLVGIQPFAERTGSLLTSGLLESTVQGVFLSWLFIKRGFWSSSLAHLAIYSLYSIGFSLSNGAIASLVLLFISLLFALSIKGTAHHAS